MRNPHSGLPFTADEVDDATLARHLEDLSVPTLLLSCVHMSGDASILDGPLKPQGLFLNEVQGFMSTEDQAAARALALEVIRDWRDRGCPEPEPVSPELLKRMMDWIASQVEHPDLLAKVVPTYPPTAKRTLQDNGSWLKALSRPDVDLVRAGVERLEAGGVVDTEGTLHPADVLVWATGFRVNDMLLPMRITGRESRDLREEWGVRPRAYLGMTVPGYPNFFMMYGPGTNLASGGSLVFHSECEIRYIVGCLRHLAETDGTAIEPRVEKYDEWYARCQDELRGMVWSSPHVEHNFYKNVDGEVHSLSPWRLVDFWTWTREPDPDDFLVR